MNIIEELEWRDAINQQTDAEGLKELVTEKKILSIVVWIQLEIYAYWSLDPVYDDETFPLAGHHPYILIGGATGTIGDPSGELLNVNCKQWNKFNKMWML